MDRRSSSPTAPPAPTRRPRSAPAWPRPRWRSGSAGRPAIWRRRSPTARRSRSSPTRATGPLDLIRHDAAHVMAEAVCELYPGTKVSIGPPIENGFYYDFEFPEGVTVTEADLERIEAKMARAHRRRRALRAHRHPGRGGAGALPSRGSALQGRADRGPDRRRGGRDRLAVPRTAPSPTSAAVPTAPSTGRIAAIKLNSLAGAYWRGDETRQMLTRIYGTAFFSKQDLAAHLERIEQAKARDHRKLGPQLDLFMFREESPGMPFWLPQGTVLLKLIREPGRRPARQARLRRDPHARGHGRRPLAPLRATTRTTARTCTSPSPPSAIATRATGASR